MLGVADYRTTSLRFTFHRMFMHILFLLCICTVVPSCAIDAPQSTAFDHTPYPRAYTLYSFSLLSVTPNPHAYALSFFCSVQSTSNEFDLRFIPDDTMFARAPRDSATAVPDDYEPPAFYTAALQTSRVDLTWDAGEQ